MTDVVVDSSAVAKWILPEGDSAQAQRLIFEVAMQGGRLLVLDLAIVEVSNAIWKRHHQGLASLDEARQFLDCLLRCPVHIHPANDLLRSALEIAAKYDRAVYDAPFVALTQETGMRGVTADEPLWRNVGRDYPTIALLRNW